MVSAVDAAVLCAELGVVGAVDVDVSEGTSCADGVSDRADGSSDKLCLRVGVAFGVVSTANPDEASRASSAGVCWTAVSSVLSASWVCGRSSLI
jgi:hypothetical protein